MKTDYTIEEFKDSSWVTVKKSSKFFALAASEEEGLRSVWIEEGRKHDDFYAVNDGVVARIDRGCL